MQVEQFSPVNAVFESVSRMLQTNISAQRITVTLKKVAGMEVVLAMLLLF